MNNIYMIYHMKLDSCIFYSFNYSFIVHSGYFLEIAPLQQSYPKTLSVQLRPNSNVLRRRHVAPGQQAHCKREFIPSGGAKNRESSTLFKGRAGPKNEGIGWKLDSKPSSR